MSGSGVIVDVNSNGRVQRLETQCHETVLNLLVDLSCGQDLDYPIVGGHEQSFGTVFDESSHGGLQAIIPDKEPEEFELLTGIRCTTGELHIRKTRLKFPVGVTAGPAWHKSGPTVCPGSKLKRYTRQVCFPVGTIIGPEESVTADCCDSPPEHPSTDPSEVDEGVFVVGLDIDGQTKRIKCDSASFPLQVEFDSHGNLESIDKVEYKPLIFYCITDLTLSKTTEESDCTDWVLNFKRRRITTPAVTFLSEEEETFHDCCFCCDGEGSSPSPSTGSSGAGDGCPVVPCPSGYVQSECCEGVGIDGEECVPETLTVSITWDDGAGCSGSETFVITYDSGDECWAGGKTWTDPCGNSRTTNWELCCVLGDWELVVTDSPLGASPTNLDTEDNICCTPEAIFATTTFLDLCPNPLNPGACLGTDVTVTVTE